MARPGITKDPSPAAPEPSSSSGPAVPPSAEVAAAGEAPDLETTMPGGAWYTPRACSMCRPEHERDDFDGDCDHWCHDAGAEDWEVGADG